MVSTAAENSSNGKSPTPRLGLFANAMKRKDSFIQFFLMTGVLMLSMRSLGQKHRIKDLQDDTSVLQEEHDSLSARMESIKEDLMNESALDKTGFFASKLKVLFDNEDNN